MHNATAVSYAIPVPSTNHIPTGRLLINDADEIIYANTQARHFLGLLAEESLQKEQKLMPLLRQTYQFPPSNDWASWPPQPSSPTSRYLIYTLPNSIHPSLLKVDIVEQFQLSGKDIWVITIQLVESPETAVNKLTV
ncbi:MAG: hypothetical protein DHS20C20_06780 [Ardenticatenaceae bacterium]|nr:MAG: hypothetical protein DHS20C20_06780 [Ardenticatenaceae bacterium]